MGSTTFATYAEGKTAKEAFEQAREDAFYYNGHAGYTGTIAEKTTFVMIPVPANTDPLEYASKLIDDDDSRISNKWGDAGCIDLKNDRFYFFGWASC